MSEFMAPVDAHPPGDMASAARLLRLVYGELRQRAAPWLAQEAPAQTIDSSALAREAYPRLIGDQVKAGWVGRGHRFAATEATRRTPGVSAYRKHRLKRGGDVARPPLEAESPAESRAQTRWPWPRRSRPRTAPRPT